MSNVKKSIRSNFKCQKSIRSNIKCQKSIRSNVKCQKSIRLILTERTSRVPPVIFLSFCHRACNDKNWKIPKRNNLDWSKFLKEVRICLPNEFAKSLGPKSLSKKKSIDFLAEVDHSYQEKGPISISGNPIQTQNYLGQLSSPFHVGQPETLTKGKSESVTDQRTNGPTDGRTDWHG